MSKIFGSGSDSDTIEIFRSGSDYQISISAQHWTEVCIAWTRFWIFWTLTPAASGRIRTQVLLTRTGSELDLDFVIC